MIQQICYNGATMLLKQDTHFFMLLSMIALSACKSSIIEPDPDGGHETASEDATETDEDAHETGTEQEIETNEEHSTVILESHLGREVAVLTISAGPKSSDT